MIFVLGNIQSVTCHRNPHCSYNINNIYIVTDLSSICLLIYSGMDTNITRGIIKNKYNILVLRPFGSLCYRWSIGV